MSRKGIFLAISGKKFHGKTEIAKYFQHQFSFHELCFATPLKQVTEAAFDFSFSQLHDSALKEIDDPRWNFSPRQAMQVIGDMFREDLPKRLYGTQDFWIQKLGRNLELYCRELEDKKISPRVVVSDLRMPDEFRFLQKNGFRILRVVRPCLDMSSQGFGNSTQKHSSETSLDNLELYMPDFMIVNDGSLEDMHTKLDKVFHDLLQLYYM